MSETDVKYNLVEIKFAQAEQPKFWERAGEGSRIDFGQNNSYPTFLNDLYRDSPKHGAIIKGKATYVFGNGFSSLTNAPNPNESESWNDLLRKCIMDDEKFNGYYLQIIWNRGGAVSSIHHIKFHKVRTNSDNSKFWVKDEWDVTRQITAKDRKAYRTYNAFDPKDPRGAQILFVKREGDHNDVYPLPSYIQAINYIDADRLISQHILGMAKDGFVASKLINFNNGEPTPEAKKQIEKGVEKKFTGSGGKRFMLSFNKNPESKVTVEDLGSTQLTKEDFTNINNLIQQEIFAAHQITSPMLFGIKTEGQLGGRSELMYSYEIFKNTYVNDRQKVHEEVFNGLMRLMGISVAQKITPVEPIGIEISDAIIQSLGLPKKYFLDKLGININEYPELNAPQPGVPTANNSVMANLTGRQFQNIMRIVREHSRGKLNWKAAATSLKTGYSLSDEDVVNFIGEEVQLEQIGFMDESLIRYFEAFGEQKESFVVVKTELFDRDKEELKIGFAAQNELDQLSIDVLNLISKDKRITPEVVSTVTKKPVDIISRIFTELESEGYLNVSGDERTLSKPVREITNLKPRTTEVLIRYSYEGPKDDRNRPFCAKMLSLDKFYSRADIEKISQLVGYSVWDRRGGWWTQPDGSHSPSCRHRWQTNVLLRRK